MAASLNRVSLIGKLGRDPESRSFSNGGKVVSMSVATSESWKDKSSGEWKEKTEWHKVSIFNEHLQDKALKLAKGDTVYVEGALETRKWQKDGVDMYTTEVVLKKFKGELLKITGSNSGSGSGDGGYGDEGYSGGTTYEPSEPQRNSRQSYDLNDDIPF